MRGQRINSVQKSRDAMSLFGRTPGLVRVSQNLRAQFGLGISLGLMIGILPKDSLLPWVLGLLALIAPVNLGATLVAIVVGTLLSLTMDSFADSIGQIVLGNATVLNWMSWLTDLPGFAWTRLNNTVVMGLTTIGILASIPVYLTAHAMYRDFDFSNKSIVGPLNDQNDDFPVVHTPNLQES